MRQSLFRKYFSMCCSITLAGIVVLGVVFMVFAAQYFQEDKLGALEKNAEYAAQMSEKYIVSVDGQYQLANNTMLTSAWIPMAKALDADIYLANMSGEVLVCTHRSACNHMVYGIGEEILDEVRENGIYTEVGKMGEIYKSSYYTAGVPLTLSDGRLAGVVFASSSAQGLTDFMSEILRVFLLSVLVMMVVIFVLAYIVSGSLARCARWQRPPKLLRAAISACGCRSMNGTRSASWRWPSTTWRTVWPSRRRCAAPLSLTSRTS